MKTTYWAMLLMLLPSMAYTQTTEKENEFTMSIQIRPRAEYRNGALMPRNEGEEPAGLRDSSITVHDFLWSTSVLICK